MKSFGMERSSLPLAVIYRILKACEEPAISHDSHHVSLVQWTNPLLPITRDLGSNPLGDLCETGILLLVLSRYIGDPEVIQSLASSPSKCFTRLRANNV